MRRWVWRVALVASALLVAVTTPLSVAAFHRACDGSLEGLRYLVSVREQLASATAPPPTPLPTSAPAPTPTMAATPTRQPPVPTTRPSSAGGAPSAPTHTPTATATHVPPTPSAAASPTPAPAGPTALQTLLQPILGLAGIAGDYALGTIVRVKQADAVAYPLHVVAAHTLDVAGCGQDAVRLQWLKAGLHASGAGQPEQVATALVAQATTPAERAELRQVVRAWTGRVGSNNRMRRVLAEVEARS